MQFLTFKNLLILFVLAFLLSSCYFDQEIDKRSTFIFDDIMNIEKNMTPADLMSFIEEPRGIYEINSNLETYKVYIYDLREYYSIYSNTTKTNIYTQTAWGLDISTKKSVTYNAVDVSSPYYFIFSNQKLVFWGDTLDIKKENNQNISILAKSIIENTKIYGN